MNKKTHTKTSQTIKVLSDLLKENDITKHERVELLSAFNTLSDLINKPKGKNNAKRIETDMGDIYVYFNEYGEMIILDSDKKQVCFLENIDEGDELSIYNYIEDMKHPSDLYYFSFCDMVLFHTNKESFITYLKGKDLLETSNPKSEIYRVGNYFLFFKY